MPAYQTAHVTAVFTRGGFGNERTYHITQADGAEAVGLAPWWYCLDRARQPIQSEPGVGQGVDGLLEARVVGEAAGRVKLYLPDGEVCIVGSDQITRGIPASTAESSRYVPV